MRKAAVRKAPGEGADGTIFEPLSSPPPLAGYRPSAPPGHTLPPQVGHGNLGGAGAGRHPTPWSRGPVVR